MRVDGSPEQISKPQQKELRAVEHRGPTKDHEQRVREADQVTLSLRAQEVQQVFQALAAIPPERAERVTALRQAVEGGHYAIPEDELAERLARVLFAYR